MRQPLPKARPPILSRGGAWRRLNSARRSSCITRSASSAGVPLAISCSGLANSSM